MIGEIDRYSGSDGRPFCYVSNRQHLMVNIEELDWGL